MNVLGIQNKLLEGGIQKDVDSLWYVDKLALIKMKDPSVFNNYSRAIIGGFTIDSNYKLLVDKHLDVGDIARLSDFLLLSEDVFISLLNYFPNNDQLS